VIYRARSLTVVRNNSQLICRPSGHRPNAGFTLLEMVVVLAIMAVIATAAAISFQKPLRAARLERAMAGLEDADFRARTEARKRSAMVELLVDGGKNIATHSIAGSADGGQVRRTLALSGGLNIDRYWTAGRSTNDDRFGVWFSPDGQSNTYAVRVSDDDDHQKWLVVVGATGQYVQLHEDRAVEAILATQK